MSRASLAGLSLTVALACITSVAHAQPGTGAPYGARDARGRCKVAAPRGAPSVAQATQSFVCVNEYINRSISNAMTLWLVQNVSLQVGRGRRFQMETDGYNDADPTATVYPIRGSFVHYQCEDRRTALDPVRNCQSYDQPNATGICYTTTFGDMVCKMTDSQIGSNGKDAVPPRS